MSAGKRIQVDTIDPHQLLDLRQLRLLERPPAAGESVAHDLGRRLADRLEAFARARQLADQGAAWLQEVAGSALVRRARELVDPAAILEQRAAARTARQATSLRSQLPQAIHEELYRHWADQPVPALGGLTPRQAVRPADGRREVIELLKEYELYAQRGPREQGLEPPSWRFLWKPGRAQIPSRGASYRSLGAVIAPPMPTVSR